MPQSYPPPGGRRVAEWVGLTVETRHELRNGQIIIPAGTVAKVVSVSSGITIQTLPCPHCGISAVMDDLHSSAIQKVSAQ